MQFRPGDCAGRRGLWRSGGFHRRPMAEHECEDDRLASRLGWCCRGQRGRGRRCGCRVRYRFELHGYRSAGRIRLRARPVHDSGNDFRRADIHLGACVRQVAVPLSEGDEWAKSAAAPAGTAKFIRLVGRAKRGGRHQRGLVAAHAVSGRLEVEMENGTVAVPSRALIVFLGLSFAIVGLGMVFLPAVAISQGAPASVIVWLAPGLVFAFVGYVTLTRVAVAATFGEGDIGLRFGLGRRLTISRTQLNRVRNLALARGSSGVAGDLRTQASPVYVLVTYTGDHGWRDFAILVLPGVGPLGGRVREFRTSLDSYVERTVI